jgi:hypothetical protein
MEKTHKPIRSFEEFWPFYLSQHQNATSRSLHYLGTTIGLVSAVYLIATQNPWLIPLCFIPGYAFAWFGHFAFEKNVPATFTYPMWSFKADFKMLFCFLTGRLKKEMQQ